MSKATEAERAEVIQKLREWIKPGYTVYTILRQVSRSGMSRHISVVVMPKDGGRPLHPNYSVSKALRYAPLVRSLGGVDALRVGGAGMDMGFDLVYNLAYVLYPDTNERGEHERGACALRQGWL